MRSLIQNFYGRSDRASPLSAPYLFEREFFKHIPVDFIAARWARFIVSDGLHFDFVRRFVVDMNVYEQESLVDDARVLPLSGKRVLDLTRNVAGPFCSMILAELGADVDKVESPNGDDTRAWGPPFWDDVSPTFLSLNRNKRSIQLDLKSELGRKAMRALTERADIVVDSFRPGSLEELGFGYEWAKSINPRIVYCRISAYGPVGPKKDLPGYDPIMQALSGLISVTGQEGDPPVRIGTSIVDMGTGMWATIAILGVLQSARDSGALVDVSLFEVATNWMTYHLASFWGTGKNPSRHGTSLSFIAPYEAFPCQDGHVIIGAPNDSIFSKLCSLLSLSNLADDPRFTTNSNRVQNRKELFTELAAATSMRIGAEMEETLTKAGVPCARVSKTSDLAGDAQAKALGIFQKADHPGIPGFTSVGMPFQLDNMRPPLRRVPPALGEHTLDILFELGLNSEYD